VRGDMEDEEPSRSIDELRPRIDGFTPRKQKKFLKWLAKTGCVRDAAGKAGISTTTIDRTRRNFADFDARCVAALDLALPGLEAIAYRRATVGAPAKVIRKGKLVEVRVQPSDAMLRLLMTGAAPGKYGRYAGMPQPAGNARRKDGPGRGLPKRLSFDEAFGQLETKLGSFAKRMIAARGYSMGPDNRLVPPGWRMVREEELVRLGWTPREGERPLPALPGPAADDPACCV